MESGSAAEEDASDGPLPWREEGPAREEVTEAQHREFERTFKEVREQLRSLIQEFDDLRVQKEKELRIAKELLLEHRALEQDRAAFDREANILAAQIGQPRPAKQPQTREAAAQTKMEMLEIQLATRSIQELKQKQQALQVQFGQEKSIWKTERQRLVHSIDQFEIENETLKLSIAQSQSRLQEVEAPAIEVIPNPESKLFRTLSPRVSRARPPSPPAQMQPPSPPRTEQPQFPTGDLLFPDYPLDFDYWPPGQSVTGPDPREVRFENGEVVLTFRDGRKKLKRRGSSHIRFPNGDVQIDFDDGAIAYRYKETMAIEVNCPDSASHCLFTNGQREVRFANGDKFVAFPDKSTKYSKANGDYQIQRANGICETCIGGVVTKTKGGRPI
jgi:hypothetical protein